jgi:hypothetical protein
MCNQVSKHHAGPDRKEIMTRETMQQCIEVIKKQLSFTTVDLTMNQKMNPILDGL